MAAAPPQDAVVTVSVRYGRTRSRTASTVGDVTKRRKVLGVIAAIPIAVCLCALSPAGPAAAAPCDPGGSLLGLVGLCPPSGPSPPPPSGKTTPSGTPGPTRSPEQPSPQPAPGTVTSRPGDAPSPSPADAVQRKPTDAPTQTGTAGVSGSGASHSVPSPPPSAPVLGSGVDTGGSAQSISTAAAPREATPSPAAGLLLVLGGALVAAGGVVGLRRYPRS